MRKHNARSVVVCEDQWSLEGAWRQHYAIRTDMPDPDVGVLCRRGTPRVIASPLNSDYIILVVQANCCAPFYIIKISM
jgi:hypothetical protein